MGYKVKHKSYGEGIAKSIRGGIIEVEFGNQVKKFQFPEAYGTFLATDDPELMEKIRTAKENLEKGEKKTAATDSVRQANYSHTEISGFPDADKTYMYFCDVNLPIRSDASFRLK